MSELCQVVGRLTDGVERVALQCYGYATAYGCEACLAWERLSKVLEGVRRCSKGSRSCRRFERRFQGSSSLNECGESS